MMRRKDSFGYGVAIQTDAPEKRDFLLPDVLGLQNLNFCRGFHIRSPRRILLIIEN
jgi:hypothetical protein